jgi:putative transposase
MCIPHCSRLVELATENWVTEYNEERPHESLGNLTPKEYLTVNQQLDLSHNGWD